MIGDVVLTIIQGLYPGGLSAFEEEGGSIFHIPDEEILIYHPNIKNRVKILSALKGLEIPVSFVSSGNFDDFHMDQIKDFQEYLIMKLMDLKLSAATVLVSRASIFISIPHYKSTQVAVKRLKDFLTTFEGVVRGHIKCRDRIVRFGNPKSKSSTRKPSRSRIQPDYGRPDREQTITEDDVLNLKIALESSKSFEEFLNNI